MNSAGTALINQPIMCKVGVISRGPGKFIHEFNEDERCSVNESWVDGWDKKIWPWRSESSISTDEWELAKSSGCEKNLYSLSCPVMQPAPPFIHNMAANQR